MKTSSRTLFSLATSSTAFLLTCAAMVIPATASAVQMDDATKANDPLHKLPLPPVPVIRPLTAPAIGDDPSPVAPGIHMVRGQMVVLDGILNMDRGPVDGLEVLACLKDGKTHESLLRLDTGNGQLVKFALVAAFGLVDGIGSNEGSGLPARGTPMRLLVQWRDDDGDWKEADASCLVRDRDMDQPYPALPYMYTGSRFIGMIENGPDNKPVTRERFMLDNTRSVVVNFDEPDALFGAPFPGAINDSRYEVATALSPIARTPIKLVIKPAIIPAELVLDDHANLHAEDAEGTVLDDAAIMNLMTRTYGPGVPAVDASGEPQLRALGIKVARNLDRTVDVATRGRLMALAGQAQVWVVPIFEIIPDAEPAKAAAP